MTLLIAIRILKMIIIFYRFVAVVIYRVSFNINFVFVFFALVIPFFFNFRWIFIILNKKIIFFIE